MIRVASLKDMVHAGYTKKDIAGMEMALKDHLYFSMKRMRHQIDVEYREYFEEEETEGKFDI